MENNDLKDFFAACAMIGLIMRGEDLENVAQKAYNQAEDMMFIRDKSDGGITTALKKRRK